MKDTHPLPVTPTLSQHHHAALQVIYDAYDRIYDVASHRWHPFAFHVAELKMSSMFGLYVQSLPAFKAVAPGEIPLDDYFTHSAPLITAMDSILALILVDDQDGADIKSIVEGRSLIFRHPHSYNRCMSVFNCIEKAFPRALFRDTTRPKKSKSKSYSTPNPTVSWLPYKD